MKDTCFSNLVQRYPCLSVCLSVLEEAFQILQLSFVSGGKVLLCGNGGSAADAEHIAGELMKGFLLPRPIDVRDRTALLDAAGEDIGKSLQRALPAIALTGQGALATAVANDNRADMIFAQQVYGLGHPGDVLLGLSTSGNSANVVQAFHVARLRGLRTIALVGSDGGRLSQLADAAIRVPAHSVPEIQELHLPIYHALCARLEASFFCDQGDIPDDKSPLFQPSSLN